MNQTDQRPKDAEEKASAAVTVIGMMEAPDRKKTKLSNSRRGEMLASNVRRRPRGPEEHPGVLGHGRDVLKCSSTGPRGETTAGVGCRFP